MFLLLFTIIYSLITQVLNLDYVLAFAIYLIGLCFAKGLLSKDFRNVFNFWNASA